MISSSPRHRRTRGFRPARAFGALAMAVAGLAVAGLGARAEDEAATNAGGTTLAVATWGGAYGQSQDVAYFEPFTQKTGVKIRTETYDGTLAAIKDKIGDGSAGIDVVDVSAGALDTLCRDGLLETMESSMLDPAPSGTSVTDDFLAGGLTSCGVASVAWSAALAFDRQAFAKAKPSKVADLLDLKRFPGKRALPNGPRYTLELALLADGVEPGNVYQELGTTEGADRAFAALDKIKAETLWWDQAKDPVTWLIEGKAAMAAGYSGRIFRAALAARQRIDVLWEGQIYDLDLWAIPKAAKNKDEAKRFITFATEPAQMAAQAELIAYGPMRKSAIALVGKHPKIGVEMKSFLPTAPDNFQKALKFDEAWWSAHGEELGKRFQSWREQASTAASQTGSVPNGPKKASPN
jgi:putative spermidine/putrescine transport system substrate-binding protein